MSKTERISQGKAQSLLAASQRFVDEWNHFCNCIDFGKSCLDADAIRFMNEVPGEIQAAINVTT